jgi:hypothetical protein
MPNRTKGTLSAWAECYGGCCPGPSLADDLLWGGRAIAAEIGVNTRKAFYLLDTGAIPARKVNGLWVASRWKLRAHFLGERVLAEHYARITAGKAA